VGVGSSGAEAFSNCNILSRISLKFFQKNFVERIGLQRKGIRRLLALKIMDDGATFKHHLLSLHPHLPTKLFQQIWSKNIHDK
jgi:hypothetical protein